MIAIYATMTSKVRKVKNGYKGHVEQRENDGKSRWTESCNIVRLNKADAYNDANDLLAWHESFTENSDCEFRYAIAEKT